jgi:hypothetical protein
VTGRIRVVLRDEILKREKERGRERERKRERARVHTENSKLRKAVSAFKFRDLNSLT